MRPIYLDANATTRPDPRVVRAMAAALEAGWGNPSSVHAAGRAARDLVERARHQVARSLGAFADEIVFTSGGTEGDHLAIRGAARAMRRATGRAAVVSSPIEHPAVLGALDALAAEGFDARIAPVDGSGRLDVAEVRGLVDERVALCSFAVANHELGTLHPIAELAAVARGAGARLHTDAVQALGKVALDVRALDVDLATVSSHKVHGPKGVGALYVRRGVALDALVDGGRQEKGRRPGTENVPGIVGFGLACELAFAEQAARWERLSRLRDRLEAGALAIAGARRFGASEPRAPGTANLGFDGVPGELLVAALDLEGVAVSTGAACSSGSIEPSPVVRALGVDEPTARLAVRFSLSVDNDEHEIDRVLAILPALVERVRRAERDPIA